LLRNYCGIGVNDDIETRRRKIETQIFGLDRRFEPSLPYLNVLLGVSDSAAAIAHVDPQIKRRRTIDAIKQIVLQESISSQSS
jgi:hypothetical protein